MIMAIDVIKATQGQKVELTKNNPGLKNLVVGLGWDPAKYQGQADFDLDASAILVGSDGKATGKGDLVYFNNLKHASGAVTHTGDNRTGVGEGDDEQIKVDLSLIPANIEKIVIVANIYDAVNRKQKFGMVVKAYIRIVDAATNTELVRYDLGEDYSTETSMLFGEIYKHNGEWKFNAVGTGSQDNLTSFAAKYGIN
jgi:tellurium resistance protein TerD